MSETKDELLKKQNDEIQKLKKELKKASKPSSMFSVLKSTVKRNVHDFFIREDRMKTMDSKIKSLEKELAKKEEELDKTSAELFAAVNLGEPDNNGEEKEGNQESSQSEPDSPAQDGPVFPQTAEDAVKEYFGPIDLAQLARYYYPEDSKDKMPEDIEKEPHQEEKWHSAQINAEPEKPGGLISDDTNAKSHEPVQSISDKEEIERKSLNTESKSEEKEETKRPERIDRKKENPASDRRPANPAAHNQAKSDANKNVSEEKQSEVKISASTQRTGKSNAASSGKTETGSTKVSKKNKVTQSKEKNDLVITPRLDAGVEVQWTAASCEAGVNLRDNVDGVSDSQHVSNNLKTGRQPNCSGSDRFPRSFPDGKPGRGLPSFDDSNENTDDKDTYSKQEPQKEQSEIAQTETDVQTKNADSVVSTAATTATVVDKNGKKKSRKDRRKQRKNTPNPEAQSAQAVTKPDGNGISPKPKQEESFPEPDFAESSIDLPDDFGVVMEPEEPLPSDLPDINSDSGNIFDDLFNSDSDNWDDSNI